MFCALVYNPGVSVSITNVLVCQFTILAGLMSLSTPAWLLSINRLSVLRYVARALMHNELHGATFFCTPAQRLPDGSCAVTSGDQVLALYGMGDVDMATELVAI